MVKDFFLKEAKKALNIQFSGQNLINKKLLDIGSGIGGADIYLAQKYNVDITGIDVEKIIY